MALLSGSGLLLQPPQWQQQGGICKWGMHRPAIAHWSPTVAREPDTCPGTFGSTMGDLSPID
eukprot:7692779-Pyramimonas_sp.AAC.1